MRLFILLLIAILRTDAFSVSPAGLCNNRLGSTHASRKQCCLNMAIASNYSIPTLPYVDFDESSSYLLQHDELYADNLNGDALLHGGPDNSSQSSNLIENILSSYAGPRVILALVAMLYGTNFPLGAVMNDNLPASAATSSRMVLASLVLSPFLLQLKPSIRKQVLIGGAFVSLGYISQSLALVDTSPALVSFLGSATVLVCPILQWLVDKKPMGIKDAPQTWLVSIL